MPPVIALWKKYRADKERLDFVMAVVDVFTRTLKERPDREGPVDVTLALEAVKEKYGWEGLEVGFEFFENIQAYIHVSPWGTFRRVEWVNETELKELFESESLQTQYGAFCDQRFIDYLHGISTRLTK